MRDLHGFSDAFFDRYFTDDDFGHWYNALDYNGSGKIERDDMEEEHRIAESKLKEEFMQKETTAKEA